MDQTAQDINAEDQSAQNPTDDAGVGALLSEEELAAALSEVESTAKAIADAQSDQVAEPPSEAAAADSVAETRAPDADGGDQESPAQDAPANALETVESSDEIEPEAKVEEEAGAVASTVPDAPLAGDVSVSNALLDEDELAAALAEIENTPQVQRDEIPSLDDGEPEADVAPSEDSADEPAGDNEPVDSEPGESEGSEESDESGGESEGEVSPDEGSSEESAAAPPKPKVRFSIGKKDPEDGESGPTAPASPSAKSRLAAVDPRLSPALKNLLRTLDQALEALDHPLTRLSESTRSLVGWGALATLLASLLAMLFLPSLLPQRDAITYLREARTQLSAPEPESEPSPSAMVEPEVEAD